MIDTGITTEKIGSLSIFHLGESMSLPYLSDIENAWQEVSETAPEMIAFDCGRLVFIDSPSIGTLVKVVNHASRLGIGVIFYDLSEATSRVFMATRLDRIFRIISEPEFRHIYLNRYKGASNNKA